MLRLWETLAECRFSIKTLQFMSHNGIERNRFIHTCCDVQTLHVLRNALRLELFLPPVVRISGTVIVRRGRGKMVSLQLYNASGKGVRQEKDTFAKEIEMTPARAHSLPVKYSVVKMILATSLEFP